MKNKRSTRRLVLIMMLVSIGGLAFAWQYYSGKNALTDPRVRPARELYQDYNRLAGQAHYDSVLLLMDRIEDIYASYPHYRDGYETAVLYNNRAAAYLSKMLESAEKDQPGDSALFLDLAGHHIRHSIQLYTDWKESMEGMDTSTPDQDYRNIFEEGLPPFTPEESDAYFEARLGELEEALEEYPRRLSVSLTNLGIIKRYRQDYDSAAHCFKTAVELWEENLTAENNLNVMLGRPLKKRSLLQKLFPPEK